MLETMSSHAMSAHHGTDVLGLAERRLSWLQARESVLAGNVANANTPGYVAKDVTPFIGVLENQMAMTLVQTEPGHMAGRNETARTSRSGVGTSRDGNEVRLENELEKVADTNDQQRLVTTAYTAYIAMYSAVLGTNA